MLSAAAADKRPLTHQDLWLMKRVGAPVASPDGKWAVASVTEPAYDAKEQVSDLWLFAIEGSAPPRKLTQTKGAESGADWSPDGTRLVFSAKREGDEVNQLYVLDVAAGGEAQRITSLSTGARSPQWSPDGAQVLFVSTVFPGAADDEANKQAAKELKERKWNARVYEGFPIRYWDHWLDEKVAHLFVQDAKPGAKARDLLAGTKLARASGFGGRQTDSGETFSAVWAPEGKSIVFIASTERDRAAYAQVTSHLFEVATAGGEPRRLTTDTGFSYGSPVFSPDGKTLVLGASAEGDGKVYHLARLVRYPWPFKAAQRTFLTADFDRDVNTPVFSADGSRLFFTAEDTGLEKIYSVPVGGGPVTVEHAPETGVFTNVDAGGAGAGFRLVGVWESASNPPEVFAYNPADKQRVRLSNFNTDTVAQLDLPLIEPFTFTSSRGRTIHNFLVRPAGFNPKKKYPVIAVIHGGPHTMYRDQWVLRWNYHLLAGTEYVLVLTNYTGSTGFGEGFAQAIQLDPLKTPCDEVNEGVDAALKRYAFLDSNRLAAGGASYGGHMANWLQATTTRYKCLIAHAGLVNLETQWGTSDVIYSRELSNGGPVWEQGEVWRAQNPQRLAGNHFNKTGWITPMMITVGEQDFRVPLNNSLENWSLHQRLQIPSKLIVFPEENHWVLKGENSKFWYGEVRAWWAKWLK